MRTKRQPAQPDLAKALDLIDQAKREGRHPETPAFHPCPGCRSMIPYNVGMCDACFEVRYRKTAAEDMGAELP